MRKVLISSLVLYKIIELETYLINDLNLSEDAALKRSARIKEFVNGLSKVADYNLCRNKRWRMMGYRCAVFEKDWVFAYEVFEEGIIVRDMSHASLLV